MILTGDLPSALDPPAGCRFHTRCPYVIDRCRVEHPLLVSDAGGHAAACHRVSELPPFTAPAAGAGPLPALERLFAAFAQSADVRDASGVDTVAVERNSGTRVEP